ncbi:MAG: hypothetical protein U5K33_04465 [Halofilum sp. (in: g-proteobacteria)]|nr:hypothetical protein [Halofilum sp. (in: g-proteobacteria)]
MSTSITNEPGGRFASLMLLMIWLTTIGSTSECSDRLTKNRSGAVAAAAFLLLLLEPEDGLLHDPAVDRRHQAVALRRAHEVARHQVALVGQDAQEDLVVLVLVAADGENRLEQQFQVFVGECLIDRGRDRWQ